MPKNNDVGVPECYKNQVTSRQACPYIASKSGRHIELLPGMSRQSASKIAEEKTSSGVDLIYDKNILAIQLLETEVQAALGRHGFMLPTAPRTRQFCSFECRNETNAAAALERGVRITQNNIESPFSCVYIEQVYIKFKTGGSTTLYIKDKLGTVLASYPVDLPANDLYILDVNLCVYEPQVFIVIDNTDRITYKTECFNGTCCSSDYNNRASKFYSVSGWTGQKCSRNGYGIGVKAGIRCDISALMCYILPYIPNAVLYQTGIEIIQELRASDRLDIVTISEQEWAEKMLPEWEAIVMRDLDVLTPTFLDQLRTQDHVCVTCKKGDVRIVSNV